MKTLGIITRAAKYRVIVLGRQWDRPELRTAQPGYAGLAVPGEKDGEPDPDPRGGKSGERSY